MKSSNFLHSLALLATLAGCGGSQDSTSKNIFGNDDRAPMTSSDYPWSTIGKVSSTLGECTGTLVGPSTVVTAAHCIVDADKNIVGTATFQPNFKNGKANHKAYAESMVWGTNDWKKFPGQDWAILELDQSLGNIYGWMGTRTIDFKFPYAVSTVGYSQAYNAGQTAGVHSNCHLQKRSGVRLLHDCDLSQGASGGPVFIMQDNFPHIVAINTSQFQIDANNVNNVHTTSYSDTTANIAIWPTELSNAINQVVTRNSVLPPEFNTNRGGSDYKSFELSRPAYIDCQAACQAESACKAFTYVPPQIQGPNARCWLKNAVPSASSYGGMVSGYRR